MAAGASENRNDRPRAIPHAPEELSRMRLRRLGEGVGRVAYASDHWVVKRNRSETEIIALIVVWKFLRGLERVLPGGLGSRLVRRPAAQIRFLRVLAQPLVVAIPKSIWFATHVGDMWHIYRSRDVRGRSLEEERLAGTGLVPRRVTFPPIQVRVGGWPGWLEVHEATERVEQTLFDRLCELARDERFDELETWLDRLLSARQSGWKLGLFSTDAHLKNFGIIGDRIVLIDSGGLTDKWAEVERRLAFEESMPDPHVRLGLGSVLTSRPDIAARFNHRWRSIVNREHVMRHWPAEGRKAS